MGALETAARTMGMEVIRLAIRRAEDIAPAIQALNGRAGGFYACADSLVVGSSTKKIGVIWSIRD
jgi:ABC-type uncharacterized transport system substrate-binding protein